MPACIYKMTIIPLYCYVIQGFFPCSRQEKSYSRDFKNKLTITTLAGQNTSPLLSLRAKRCFLFWVAEKVALWSQSDHRSLNRKAPSMPVAGPRNVSHCAALPLGLRLLRGRSSTTNEFSGIGASPPFQNMIYCLHLGRLGQPHNDDMS